MFFPALSRQFPSVTVFILPDGLHVLVFLLYNNYFLNTYEDVFPEKCFYNKIFQVQYFPEKASENGIREL